MMANCRNGVSSYEIYRTLGGTPKSAWFMMHRIRLAMKSANEGGKLGGHGKSVESDEAFIGGKTKNMHKSRRLELQRVKDSTLSGNTKLIGKTAVWGLLDREQRKVRATVVQA